MRTSLPPFEPVRFDALPERPRRPHPYHELEARDIEVRCPHFGSTRAHVRELGAPTAPPLVLIHGLMTTGYSWRYVVEPLAERYRVLVPDLVGCGRSSKPDRPYTARAIATWIGALLDAMDARGARVVGNSLGGYFCLRLAVDDPTAMQALVNIHSPAFVEPRLVALHNGLRVPGARAVLAAVIARDPLRWAHRHVHYRDETLKSFEEAQEYGRPLTDPMGRRAFIQYLGESLDPAAMRELVEDLEQTPFPVPLRLVYAREDPVVRPSNGPRLQAVLDGTADLVWLEKSSHFAQVDTPGALVDVIYEFFEANAL